MARPNFELAGFASFARELAANARRETLGHFSRAYAVEDKNVGGAYDPVTEADRAAESAMRELIGTRFPDHGIRGEEFPDKLGTSALTWSLDPIDGTRSFICGMPTWTTLIALLDEGEPVVGLIDAPLLDETFFGFGNRAVLVRKGKEAAIRSSGCARMGHARFSTTDPFLIAGNGLHERIAGAVRTTRYGYDGYAYAMLAAGGLDLVIESGLKPHDYNALIPVIRAAGGHIGDWRGGADFTAGSVIAAASRALYEDAVALIAGR